MSIKRFEFLKETLSKIDNEKNYPNEIQLKIKQERSALKGLKNNLSQLNKIKREDDAAFNGEPTNELKKNEEQLKELNDKYRLTKAEDKKFESLGGISYWEFERNINLECDEIKTIPLKYEGIKITGAILLGIIGFVLSMYAGITYGEMHAGEWTCDNGEVISERDVQNDHEDCSDGSDEDDGGWVSESRSEGAEDDMLTFMEMGICLVGLTITASIIYALNLYFGEGAHIERQMGRAEEHRQQLQHYQKEKLYYEDKNKEIQTVQLQINRISDHIKELKSLISRKNRHPKKISSLEKSIEQKKQKLSNLELNLNQSLENLSDYWNSISDMIPDSELNSSNLNE